MEHELFAFVFLRSGNKKNAVLSYATQYAKSRTLCGMWGVKVTLDSFNAMSPLRDKM